MTYGQVGRIAGVHPRVVGAYLHHNPYPGIVPCHRVVSADGRLAKTFAFGGRTKQTEMLTNEEVRLTEGTRVDTKTALLNQGTN